MLDDQDMADQDSQTKWMFVPYDCKLAEVGFLLEEFWTNSWNVAVFFQSNRKKTSGTGVYNLFTD